jgi:hypothetical protein
MEGKNMANKSKSVQMSSASPSPLSRRTFLGRMGVSTAVAATAVGMPSLLGNKVLASQEVESPDVAGIIPEAELSGGVGGERRRERAFRNRIRAAHEEFRVPIPSQVNNGDEASCTALFARRSTGAWFIKTLSHIAEYPLDGQVLNSDAVSRVFSKYGSYLLPQANPEGCPLHTSYPEAHGVVAGSTVTALKAFFNQSFVIPNPVVASDDGESLLPYSGADLTVGNELNKLANNIALGRDIEGVHWRSDAAEALLLGEAAAISILRDQRRNFNEPFTGFTFTKFDGSTITV